MYFAPKVFLFSCLQQRVERELHGKQQQQQSQQLPQSQQHTHNHLLLSQYPIPQDLCPSSIPNTPLQNVMNLDIVSQQQQQQQGKHINMLSCTGCFKFECMHTVSVIKSVKQEQCSAFIFLLKY